SEKASSCDIPSPVPGHLPLTHQRLTALRAVPKPDLGGHLELQLSTVLELEPADLFVVSLNGGSNSPSLGTRRPQNQTLRSPTLAPPRPIPLSLFYFFPAPHPFPHIPAIGLPLQHKQLLPHGPGGRFDDSALLHPTSDTGCCPQGHPARRRHRGHFYKRGETLFKELQNWKRVLVLETWSPWPLQRECLSPKAFAGTGRRSGNSGVRSGPEPPHNTTTVTLSSIEIVPLLLTTLSPCGFSGACCLHAKPVFSEENAEEVCKHEAASWNVCRQNLAHVRQRCALLGQACEFSSPDFRSNSISSRTPTPPGCYSPHSPVEREYSASPRRNSEFNMQRFDRDSEVYKMIQENKESRSAPRQSNTFRMLQEVLEADEKEAAVRFPGKLSPSPPKPSSSVAGVQKFHTCEKCGTSIVTQAVRIMDDRFRHPECYTCTECGLNLKMRGHFWVGEQMFCEKHARERYQGPGSNYRATVSPHH
ncbi:hypothetical protein JZ751_001501, partial [Albula glossodonta]